MAPSANKVSSSSSRERILENALGIIQSRGIFSLSVSEIVSASGISRPTFYSYFGDLDGLLAELWFEQGEPWINNLMSEKFTFDPNSEESSGLIDILLLAHRNPQVAEVVKITFAKISAQYVEDPGSFTLEVWRLANRLGVLATIRVWPAVSEALILDDFLKQVKTDRIENKISSIPDLPEIALELNEDSEREIVEGVIAIVSSSGVAGLSILRLGRLMRVTSGYLQPRIENMSELVGKAYYAAQSSAASQNVALWSNLKLSPEGFARFIVGSVGNSRRAWRWFRAEVMLAAVNDPILAEIVRESMDSLVSTLDRKTISLGFVGKLSSQVATLVHTMLFGFTALSAVGVDVRALSHEGLIRQLLSEAVKRLLWKKPQ